VDNILSIDFESWVHFYRDALREEGFGRNGDLVTNDDGYVPYAAGEILALLAQTGQQATFFIVGEIYDSFPQVIESIVSAGHEIGYHTHTHRVLANARELDAELGLSRAFLERFRPLGFRAPYIHLPAGAWEVLERNGFRYSSSTYRTTGPSQESGLREIPVSCVAFRKGADTPLPNHMTLGLLTRQIPFGSGLFLALLGRGTSRFIARENAAGRTAVLFTHPWQLYQPPILRSYAFRARVLARNPMCLPYTRCILAPMRALLARHRFTSFQRRYFDSAA
jgi:peptidoglycan/xylan/chitin deacetylase (PgdA/CDA1 family)